ncbi:hypothetical protein LCGC14_1727150 [marine sediment metagenome]|uniref:Uncharacterized protein n=1 Tax=marine sediment metagenome TaxID=412755 RepID=A0A0F9KAC9_9ZZZZ
MYFLFQKKNSLIYVDDAWYRYRINIENFEKVMIDIVKFLYLVDENDIKN